MAAPPTCSRRGSCADGTRARAGGREHAPPEERGWGKWRRTRARRERSTSETLTRTNGSERHRDEQHRQHDDRADDHKPAGGGRLSSGVAGRSEEDRAHGLTPDASATISGRPRRRSPRRVGRPLLPVDPDGLASGLPLRWGVNRGAGRSGLRGSRSGGTPHRTSLRATHPRRAPVSLRRAHRRARARGAGR